MFKRIRVLLIVLALLGACGYYGWGRLQETVDAEPPQLVEVKRGLFIHEILERGSLDSARNFEIRCQVESAGGLTIISVVPEGTLVKAGDLLIELDSSTLRENIQKQQIAVFAAESKLAQSQADLKTAQLTLSEYLEGLYVQQEETIKSEIFTADEQVKTQEDTLSFYKRLWERGYVTDAKVDADLIELKKAENAKDIAEIKLKVLNKYTKEKSVTQYQATIDSCLIKVKADTASYKLESERLKHLQDQEQRCTIRAERDGQVVYFMPRWGGDEDLIKEGKKVFERQILLLLPDPTQMQVEGLINEANIRLVKPGQTAAIRLEAFPNQVFDGVVQSVNDYPEPSSFFGASMSKEYMATVTVLDPPEGIKTGLTAEAKIKVDEIPDALLVPMQAVFAYGGKTYAVTYKEGKWSKIEVKTGPANEKEVSILEGLNEGDEVVLGAWAHRDKIDLPKLEESSVLKVPAPEEEQKRRENSEEKEKQESTETPAEPAPVADPFSQQAPLPKTGE